MAKIWSKFVYCKYPVSKTTCFLSLYIVPLNLFECTPMHVVPTMVSILLGKSFGISKKDLHIHNFRKLISQKYLSN